MLKIVMIGVMLLMMFSCKPPTIKEPVKMFVINTSFYEAGVGTKNLDIRTDGEITSWIEKPKFIPLDEAPENMMCFDLKDWLEIITPKLKEGNHYYHDYK